MTGILPMAALTILLTAILCFAMLNHLTGSDRRYYWLLVPGLPLSLIVNRWIKIPVLTALATQAGIPLKLGPAMPAWFIVLIWLNAPVFEEAIKVLPLALPGVRRFLQDPSRSLYTGLALGMGFGLGEAAYLAYGIAQSPEFNTLPWYVFTGFAVERLVVTFAHGFMTSITALGFHDGGRKALTGYLAAVGFHALINLGAILMALKLLSPAASGIATYVAILAAFIVFQRNQRTARRRNGTTPKEIVYFER